jgi:IS5 family transposase
LKGAKTLENEPETPKRGVEIFLDVSREAARQAGYAAATQKFSQWAVALKKELCIHIRKLHEVISRIHWARATEDDVQVLSRIKEELPELKKVLAGFELVRDSDFPSF